MTVQAQAATPGAQSRSFRWLQLAMGIVCMAMIANLQYGWTLFVDPIDAKYHWGRAAIQLAFTLFVLTETWLVPVEAWFVDKYGPRVVVIFGAVMITARMGAELTCRLAADALRCCDLWRSWCRVGLRNVRRQCAEVVSGSSRLSRPASTAAGFGAGAALTVVPIAQMITTSGYQTAFFDFGIGQGLIVLVVGSFPRKPEHAIPVVKKEAQPAADQT